MKKKLQRYFAFFMALNIIFEVISPTLTFALTNGVIQPEFLGFESANSSEMVDLFTGDFKYNIPLMDVDGYPLNLSYHAGAGMENEASWVGLGWSMNPGVLNRMVKGVPDDFNGDVMKSETHMKPHVSMGLGFQSSAWFGFNVSYKIIGAGAQIGVDAAVVLTYNNYKGYGIETQLDGNATLSANIGPLHGFVGGGVGMTLSSQDGGTLSYQHSKGFGISGCSASIGEGTSINTRSGAMTKTYFGNLSVGYGGYSVGLSTSHTLPSGSVAYSPKIANDYKTYGFGLSAKFGLWGCIELPLGVIDLQLKGGILAGFKGFYNKTDLASYTKTSNSYGYLYLENARANSMMDFNRFKDGAISEEVPNAPLANKTYDNFAATAQGMGSSFRAFRSDVGIVHDTYNVSTGLNAPLSTEFSALLFLHSLTDIMFITNRGESGNWDTQISNTINFQNKDVTQVANRYFEKAYFKQFGEIAARNSTFDNSLANESAVSPALNKVADGYEASASGGLSGTSRNKRDIRNTNISYLTASQANEYGFEKTMKFYDINIANHTVNAATRMVDYTGSNVSRLTKAVPGNSNYPLNSHISEISMTNTSGSRYVYGIPSYNIYKKRVMFNASSRTEPAYQANGYPTTSYSQNPLNKSNTHQLVEYNPATDLNSNKRGSDNFYTSDETPAHANSYLLTCILSSDYMDVSQDGPTYDDLGTFTKFNYSKVSNFGWREPYGASGWATDGTSNSGTRGTLSNGVTNQANFDKGLISDALDDRGFYEYGNRENYYLQSIETKNHVAFFECSQREDFMGVSDEHGTADPTKTYKLDKIKLYSKSELLANGSAAVPLKVVNFVYSYDLCPNTFNSGATTTHGKLTLTKVFFTYGNSQRTALSPYQFYYGDNNHDNTTDTYGNPAYNNKAADRWGNYKPNSTNSGIAGDETPDLGVLGKLNNIEFPYCEQDEDLANQYAVAWNLTKIITPSNAAIEITYEADDYGYVQNELAGQMLMINNTQETISPLSQDASAYPSNSDIFQTNYLIIDLQKLNKGIPANMPIAQANTLVKKNMFRPNTDMYYKCFMHLAGPANSFGLKENYYDYVPGYATIQDAGLYTSGISGNTYTKNSVTYYKYAYVRLKKEIAYASTEVSPISLSSWEFMRSFLPRVAYPGSEPANMGDGSHKPVKQFANALVGLGVALADFVSGVSGNPNFRFHFRKFCKEMDYSKSFVRALVPLKKKKGGGYRVKQLITRDSWKDMTVNTATGYSEASGVYGQGFNYTMKDVDNVTDISSGVAYYEPLQGGDEISLRKPIKFELEKKMAPNDHLFQEEPYGEMLFPTGQVGYSKVTVTPLADDKAPNLYKIGKSVFEFYTAKDYPIIETRTNLKKELYQNDLIEHFTVVQKAYKILHIAQGHVVKLNDMHGKLKAINTYGEDNLLAPISGASYTYKDAAYNKNSRQLVTSAKTISESNVITTEQIARDIDVTVDNRSNTNESTTTGESLIIEISLCSPATNIGITVLDGYDKTGLKSSVSTKIVQQYGILEKSEVFDDKSRTLSENLLWDRSTGEVVVSKTTNNLEQPVYTLNYPAYWAYPKMGHEFRREGIILKIPADNTLPTPIWNRTTGTLSKAALVNPEVLAIGDEVIVYKANTPIINGKRYWITYDMTSLVQGSPSPYDHNYCLVDAEGIILKTSTAAGLSLTDEHYIKVVRSVERNQLTESAGSTSALGIPALAGSSFNITGTNKVIHANAQTWCSGWNFYLKEDLSQQQTNCLYTNYNQTPVNEKRFNPYTSGVLGNWRPYITWTYNVNRSYDNIQANVKSDGTYDTYLLGWTYYNTVDPRWQFNAPSGWVASNTNNVYSPYGYLMENKDAIGIYHSQRYGFNHTLPTLSAANARVRQVGFESFEDYKLYYPAINTCNVISNDQLDFYNQVVLSGSTKPLVTTAAAHTGRTSLSFNPSQAITLTHYINKTPTVYTYENSTITHDDIYICGDDPALNKLYMVPGTYIVSFWVKNPVPSSSYAPNFAFNVTTQNGGGTPATLTSIVKQSGIINGWQKFDYQFTIPFAPTFAANSLIRFNLTASSAIYMDDFRLQPFNSSMVCTVYDPQQMRVWAQLDDNNYATIMEYDTEGALVRKKKETVKGLYTVQETRQATAKRN